MGAATATATVLLGVGNPNTTHVPLCPLRAATGLDCPFCGSLRAVHSLARLRPVEAASHNLLLTLAVPVLILAWAIWMRRSLRPATSVPPFRLPSGVAFGLVGLVVAFFVARNLAMFSWLASPA